VIVSRHCFGKSILHFRKSSAGGIVAPELTAKRVFAHANNRFKSSVTLTIAGIILTILGLVMAFARTGPEEAKKNLARWAETLGILSFKSGQKSQRPDLWIARIGTAAAAAGTGLLANALNRWNTVTLPTGILLFRHSCSQ
jgi:hypothetical protein